MNGTTNKVQATAAGAASTTVIFIFGYPTVTITGGNNQVGVAGGRLENPLIVKVTDGKNRVISGLAADFDIASGVTGAMFIPVPGTTVYTDSTGRALVDTRGQYTREATATRPTAGTDIVVQTDSRGEAKTYFQLGTTPVDQSVTVKVGGESPITPSMFTLEIGSTSRRPTLSILSGNNQRTDEHGELENPLVVVVRQEGHLLPGQLVTFRATRGTLVGVTSSTIENGALSGSSGHAKRVYDLTNSSGEAQVTYFQDPGEGSDTVRATIGVEDYDDTDFQRRVTFNINGGTSGGGSVPSTPTVSISASSLSGAPGAERTITVSPSTASINFAGSVSGSGRTRTVTLPSTTGDHDLTATATGYNPRSITFTVTRPASDTTDTTASGARLSIDVTGSGSSRTVTVTALSATGRNVPGLSVTLSGAGLSPARTVQTGAATSLVLSSGTLLAQATGFASASETITVGAAASSTLPATSGQGTLTVSKDGAQVGTQQPILVRAIPTPSRNLRFTVTRGGVSVGVGLILTTGTGKGTVTVPATGLYVLTVSADGYTSAQASFTAGAQTTDTTTTTTTPPPPDDAPDPSSIEISGSGTHNGTLNTELDDPLRVRVLDADDNGVSNVRVIFRVRTGQGQLSDRGNGRATSATTDRRGYASTVYTPQSASSTVSASVTGVSQGVTFTITTSEPPASITKVSGDSQSGTPGKALANPFVVEVADADGEAVAGIPVTFSVTAGGGSLSAETATTDADGRASTKLTLGSRVGVNSVRATVSGIDPVTFSTSVEPNIQVSKTVTIPVLYFIESGALYRLAGGKSSKIAESANDVVVDPAGGKVYWITQTSETTGNIHSANLDGSGTAVVKKITAAPIGLALDTANSKLYLINGWSKAQRMNIDGTGYETNLLMGLASPRHIAASGGNVYWTEGSGTVRFMTAGGTSKSTLVSGAGTIGGLIADSSKVYWTEQTGERSGRVRSANHNGTDVQTLFTIGAMVHGIAIDSATGDLYWSNGWGKIQTGAKTGGGFKDVATGFMTPGAIAIGGANTAAAVTTTPTTTTATGNYDVDDSGTVDNVDVFLVALAVGTNTAKYDVNGDGTVDAKDISLVRDNRDAGAAGAPMVVGVKLTAEQVGRLQEQIDLLVATNDRSPAAMKTLVYLQQLIATARPEKTQLLANYPNPFNPETWIPYELAADTDVRITIYTAQGVVIRTLQLGQQSAGYYTDRERAAYWDGRNALGEQVASGIYFYQLETDEMSSMRKMVILK